MANSRDGVNTRTWTLFVLFSRFFRTGKRKASVFPEPVGESRIMSLCLLIASTDAICMALRASILSVESILLINFQLLSVFGEGTTKQLVNAELKSQLLDSMVHRIEQQFNS